MRINLSLALFSVLLLAVFASGVCAAKDENLLIAVVNGEQIRFDKISEAMREIHMFKPQARAEGENEGLDVDEIVNDIVNERLIIQEARRLNLQNLETYKHNIDEFIAVQSVLRMKREEVDQKAKISDEEAVEYFKGFYKGGEDNFEEEFQRHKSSIKRKLSKEKEDELSEAFINKMREQADIVINSDLVMKIDPFKETPAEDQAVATVGQESISAADYARELENAAKSRHRSPQEEPITPEIKDNVLNNMIRYSLLRQEAIRRNYPGRPDFAQMVDRRKEVLLIEEFKRRVIVPAATPSSEEIYEYYEKHPDEFLSEIQVRIMKMEIKDEFEARRILQELRAGADFKYMLSAVQGRRMQMGKTPWLGLSQLPGNVREALKDVPEGEVSDVLNWGRDYTIVKVVNRRGGDLLPFEDVSRMAAELAGRAKFKAVLDAYIEALRDEADIEIYQQAVEKVRGMFFKEEQAEEEKSGA